LRNYYFMKHYKDGNWKLALLSSISVFTVITCSLFEVSKNFVILLYGLASIIVFYSILKFLKTVSEKELVSDCQLYKNKLKTHLYFQFVPFLYIGVYFVYTNISSLINAVFLLPLILFFLTGRMLWQESFRLFQSKIYRAFYLGNTAMLIWMPLLLLPALLDISVLEVINFTQFVTIYFAIHFLITGFSILKLEHDTLQCYKN